MTHDSSPMLEALATLADVPYSSGASPLFTACDLVGRATGIAMIQPSHRQITIATVATASGVRWRRVALRDSWWQTDSGALLGTLREGQQPVALLPASPSRYILYNPATATQQSVDANTAAILEDFAVIFYRPLPANITSLWDLLSAGVTKRDVWMVLFAGILVGLIQLIPPVLARLLFDVIIPTGNRVHLPIMALLVLICTVVLLLLNLTQGIALIRLVSRMEAIVQSGVMDRLLRLPLAFFRQYPAGDLSLRTLGIHTIAGTLSGITLFAFFSAFFSLLMLILMFAYDVGLATLALMMVLATTTVMLVGSYQRLRYGRRINAQQGKRESTLFQIFNGIARVRLARAEIPVFRVWSQQFSEQRAIIFQDGRLYNQLAVLNVIFSAAALMVIYAAAAQKTGLSVGTFVGFSVAFTQFTSLWSGLNSAFMNFMALLPHYERVRPLLMMPLETAKAQPGILSGALEVQHVSFSYGEDLPLALHDVSFRVAAGEFVAITGVSGSGKSTLLRLLAGLEQPQTGSIYYDGQPLTALDGHQVRQQMGVVLQTSRLIGGQSIAAYLLENGGQTLDAAWEALQLVGLDQEIKQLPMNIHTLLAEGGVTLAGGQRQRLLIARALVNRPRLLLLDEATAALDNQTQNTVMIRLAALKITRIIIAHRASTIMHADRVIVLDNGSISQIGTYAALTDQPGIFAALVKPQLL